MPNSGAGNNPQFQYSALLKRHLTYSDDKVRHFFYTFEAKYLLKIEYDPQEVLRIIKDSKDIIAAEPTLLEIQLPCIVVGDIHGQVSVGKSYFQIWLFIFSIWIYIEFLGCLEVGIKMDRFHVDISFLGNVFYITVFVSS